MDARGKWRFLRIILTFSVLMVVWLLFSAALDLAFFAIGAVGAMVISAISYDVFIEDFEAGKRAVIPRLIPLAAYPFRLASMMYASSFRVLFAVLSGRTNPRVVHFRSRLRSDLARVVLAHSITFTPGTIALDLDEDHYIVHWLFATTRHSSRAGEEVKGAQEQAVRRIWS